MVRRYYVGARERDGSGAVAILDLEDSWLVACAGAEYLARDQLLVVCTLRPTPRQLADTATERSPWKACEPLRAPTPTDQKEHR